MAGLLFAPFPAVTPPAQPHPTLVVLGAAQYAGRPSPAFKVRLDHALKLYQGGGVRRIVVTGGRQPGDPYSEGGVGQAYLERRGVPADVLRAETSSRTTYQNLTGAREWIEPGAPITLVTDKVHAPRALAMARSLGFEANASPSPLWKQVTPRYLLRERLALLSYTLFGVRG
ncbi:YdcF family protein [Deinococcus lacus]|uniref:YdcF family protein n=1 Tax=Deinococcus lacus TaxID=392561 RepID=A0ABW1YC26_9DEIO